MQWVGKAVGGILGFAAAGPVGSVLGLIVGHQFDQGAGPRVQPGPAPDGEAARFFFQATFEIMGRIAKADGRVSEAEIRAARRIMHTMELSPEQVTAAINHFTAGKSEDYPLAERLEELKKRLSGRRDLARAFVEIQMQAAIGAGEIERTKRRLLWRVASALGVGRVELAQIEALIRAQRLRSRGKEQETGPSLGAAYRVLGVTEAASDREVKTAYRRLMNQHHPDKLVARGLPESMVTLAEQKTHEIRAAYEQIKSHRAFK
ncbi:MAG: co-chaperone DjlA [Gammaproteobacteria bacterium]|nr:co-chaperone DjlA [Gammaproteobacteria bacterium]